METVSFGIKIALIIFGLGGVVVLAIVPGRASVPDSTTRTRNINKLGSGRASPDCRSD